MLRSIACHNTNDEHRPGCSARVRRRAMVLRAGMAAGGASLLLAGCFVADPFNTPPSLRVTCEFVDGRPCSGDNMESYRGDRVRLHMLVGDPEHNADPSTYGWEAFTCSESGGTGCVDEPFDAQHYDEQRGLGVEFEIPARLPDDVGSVSLDFEVRDDRGAINDTQFIVFHLIDGPVGRAGAP